MARYYMLECVPPFEWDDCALLDRAPSPPGGESWTGGVRFSRPPSTPLTFRLLANHNDRLLELDNSEALLMSKRLLAALYESGVDNIDVYDAVIEHPVTHSRSAEYVAVNLIGLVSAVDLAASKVVPGGLPGGVIDVGFDSVVLDESRPRGALMFRLAENTNALVVHESVKAYLESRGFTMLSFIPPEEWMG